MRGFEKVSAYPQAIIPTRATQGSAGYDLSIYESVSIKPGEVCMCHTGIKAYMPLDEVLCIFIRSSMAVKKHLSLANNVGIIDADYYNNENNEGHIMIPIYNFGQEPITLNAGEKIAQAIFMPYYTVSDEDSIENKRSGGFGSTNKE